MVPKPIGPNDGLGYLIPQLKNKNYNLQPIKSENLLNMAGNDQKGLCNVNVGDLHDKLNDHSGIISEVKYLLYAIIGIMLILFVVYLVIKYVQSVEKKKYEQVLRDLKNEAGK